MLPLVSSSKPEVQRAGSSSPSPRAKYSIACVLPSSMTSKSSLVRSVTRSPFRSVTVTPKVARSTPARKTGCAASRRATTDDQRTTQAASGRMTASYIASTPMSADRRPRVAGAIIEGSCVVLRSATRSWSSGSSRQSSLRTRSSTSWSKAGRWPASSTIPALPVVGRRPRPHRQLRQGRPLARHPRLRRRQRPPRPAQGARSGARRRRHARLRARHQPRRRQAGRRRCATTFPKSRRSRWPS